MEERLSDIALFCLSKVQYCIRICFFALESASVSILFVIEYNTILDWMDNFVSHAFYRSAELLLSCVRLISMKLNLRFYKVCYSTFTSRASSFYQTNSYKANWIKFSWPWICITNLLWRLSYVSAHQSDDLYTIEIKNTGALFYLTTRITHNSDPTAWRQAPHRLPLLRLACVEATSFSSGCQFILSYFLVPSFRENAG
jgi:hypothetical protein